jgi:hypothetical protein
MDIDLIWVFREAIYFLAEGWTGIRRACPSGKSLRNSDGDATS